MTGRDAARLAELAGLLTEVDEFLRSPTGHAALAAWYACDGRIAPGYDAGLLIDHVTFTALTLRARLARRPHSC